MPSVRIHVDHDILGDIEVRVESRIVSVDSAANRRAIDSMITEASEKIRRAYEIEQP